MGAQSTDPNAPVPDGTSTGDAGSPASSGTPASLAGAVGVTASTISIGVMYLSGTSVAAAALGISGADTGDEAAMAKSVVAYLNSHGGIAGRKVVATYYEVNANQEESNKAGAEQAACTEFTQDTHVFAVISMVAFIDTVFYDCMKQHRAIVVATGELASRSFMQAYDGSFYAPSGLNYTRVMADNVEALYSAGWFGKTPKIGVLEVDAPGSKEPVTDGLIPALARHGLKLADQYVLADGAASLSGYASAVLKFRAEGIDHVFFSEGTGLVVFAPEAQSDGYHPKYAIDTVQNPGNLVESSVQPGELNGTMGIGWDPFADLDPAHGSGVATPAKAQCVQAVKAAGQNLSSGSTMAAATGTCDNFFFLRTALAKATSFTPTSFQSLVQSLKQTFAPAATFKTLFAPGRTADGASAYRLNTYSTSCSCFIYNGGVRPLNG